MQPFTLHMPNLFESFVAEWLRSNMDSGMYISPQYKATLDDDGRFLFRIDLVLVDAKSEKILAVMDTKYKRESRPSEEDIKDIVAYAARMKTACGILIYPSVHTENINLRVGNINVRSLNLDLADNPEDGGRRFLDRLMAILQGNIRVNIDIGYLSNILDILARQAYTGTRRGSGVGLGVITETLCFPEGTLKIIAGPQSPIRERLLLVGLFHFLILYSLRRNVKIRVLTPVCSIL